MARVNINQQLGLRVRELRLSHGWSQEELGARSGIDRTYVSGVERGIRNPTITVVAAIAGGLNVSVAELFSSETGL